MVSMTTGKLQCSVLKRIHFLKYSQYKRSDRINFAAFRGSQSYFAFSFLLPSTVAFLFKSISCSFLTDRLFEMSNNLLSISTFLGCPVNF